MTNNNIIQEINLDIAASKVDKEKAIGNNDAAFLILDSRIKALEWVLTLFEESENE